MKKITTIASALFLQFGGIFAQPTAYTVNTTAFLGATLEGGNTQIRLADMNQDGHLDLVSIGDHASPNINSNQHGVMVWFGDGTGTSFPISMNGGFGYGGCAVGDINNDGKQDIAYGHHHGGLMGAQIGNGTGTGWSPYGTGLGTNGETWGMFGTDLGDVNNDGWLDIASNSFGAGNGVRIYKNNKNGSWTQSAKYGVGGNTGKYVQYGDFDGDGNLDLIVSNDYGATYFGNGTGTFSLKTGGLPVLAQDWPYEDVSAGDIDNDGDDDIVFSANDIGNGGTGVRGVYVYKYDKSTQQWVNSSSGLPTSTSVFFYIARMGDMDMDGFLDVLTYNFGTKNLEIYKGNGGTSWSLWKSIPFTDSYQGVVSDIAIGDVNHSGYPDIAFWYNSATSANKVVLIKDDVTPTELKANLTYPKGAECWPNNAVRFINWVSAVPSNHSSSVKIEYSTTGNTGPWTVIAAAAKNNGIYQWNVPASVNSSSCFIQVTITDNVTSSNVISMNVNAFSMGCNSSTTGVNEQTVNGGVALFPNPMQGSVTIKSDWTDCSVTIVDVTGNVVKSVLSVDQFPLVMERGDIASGIYVVEVTSGDRTERKKLVVE